MDFGLHLPLIDFGGNPFTLDHLIAYAETGHRLGFKALAANDHLVFSKPWLDGPTALAAVLSHSGRMDLATKVSLPIVRGPVPLAKSLVAIDRLSGGRLTACVGPGSSARDYAAVGIPFEERWKRLEEAVRTLRIRPGVATASGLPGDGGQASVSFPNAIASVWLYITENGNETDRVLAEVLAPALNRPVAELRQRLPVGSAQACAEKLAAYQDVGVQRIYLWPVAGDLEQIQNFMNQVVPLIDGSSR